MKEVASGTIAARSPDPAISLPLRVLMVEDHPLDAELCIQELKKAGFETRVDLVDSQEQFEARLGSQVYDIVLSDYGIPGWSGLGAFRQLKQSGKDIPFILVTGTLGEEAAVELMREGVSDYILKDRLTRLPLAVRGTLAEAAAREAKRRAEERFHRLAQAVESSSELMAMGDREGKITFANHAFLQTLGFTEAELVGQPFPEYVLSPDNPAELGETIKSSMQRKGGWTGECSYRRKDGGDLPVYLSAGQVKDASNVVIGSFASAQDVTERNWTMRALRESEERVRLLLDSTSEAIYGVDLQNRCFLSNRAGARLLGYDSPAELLGKNMHILAHHTHLDGTPYPEEECTIRQAVQQGGSLYADNECLWRKDGSCFPVELRAHPIIWNGERIGSVTTFLDITERKRTEEDLRRLAAIVESSHDSIIGESLDGTILSWNAGAQRIYGYSAEEATGKSAMMLTPADRQTEATEVLEHVREGQKVEPFETVRVRKDGKRIHVALTLSEIKDTSGRVSGVSVIARDITEAKRLEEMYRQAQKMEAIGRLAGGIAHDFNNMLGVIIGYSEMLLESLSETSEMRKPVEEIKKAGDRAASLTRQLLAYSRQQVLERRVVNLNQLVAEMENMLRRMIGEDVELRTVLDPVLGQVKADPGQIQQAIMNLAVNARDAMPKGGILVLETGNVELDEAYDSDPSSPKAGPYVLLAVSDSGMGMDAETQARIFEPFFTTKESGKGTGLGLSSVYGVVHQTGGHIRVYSEVGHGTAFKVYLPRIDEHAQQTQQGGADEHSYRGSETVLLVEDEESLRRLTRQFLDQSGYHVLEASTGAHALEVVQEHRGPIHLLLTDVVMPGMSGPALAATLASLHPETKMLYMSGYTGGFAIHNGLLDPSMRLLQKPFSREGLLRRIRQVLEVES